MAINAQSGVGKIRLFNDFCGTDDGYSDDASSANLGDFLVGGEGIEEATAGCSQPTSGGLSGVCRLSTHTEDLDTAFIGTGINFDVALMAPIVVEARVQFVDLDTKAAFIGLTSVLTYDEQMDDIIDYSAATTVTLTATLAGFFLSSEFTEDEMWHCVYNGGTTTGQTDTEEIESGVDAVKGEWQVLRLEVDPNGTARWYIDGALIQTTVGAISTTTDLAVCCGVTNNGTAEATVMDVDYLLVEANRDWNA
jgi:hypothetical protein